MNLKEAYHYQSVLDGWMQHACAIITNYSNIYDVTKIHMYSDVDESRQNVEEKADRESEVSNDDVIKFMDMLIREKANLTEAVTLAEMKLGFDINAAIATNKMRNTMINNLTAMLKNKSRKQMSKGTAYKFNNEGNQNPYIYDIEVHYDEAFDRKATKAKLKELQAARNLISVQIDSAQVNTVVDYTPMFDEGETVEELVAEFIENSNDQNENN